MKIALEVRSNRKALSRSALISFKKAGMVPFLAYVLLIKASRRVSRASLSCIRRVGMPRILGQVTRNSHVGMLNQV